MVRHLMFTKRQKYCEVQTHTQWIFFFSGRLVTLMPQFTAVFIDWRNKHLKTLVIWKDQVCLFVCFFPQLVEYACSAGVASNSGLVPRLGRSPGEGNDTALHILAWEIPWIEEPAGLQATEPQRVGHNLATAQQDQ